MLKRMMTLLVLSGLVGGVAFAMSTEPAASDRAAVEAAVEAQIDARLHEVLVKMRLQRAELEASR